jgi:hypothetical protein
MNMGISIGIAPKTRKINKKKKKTKDDNLPRKQRKTLRQL